MTRSITDPCTIILECILLVLSNSSLHRFHSVAQLYHIINLSTCQHGANTADDKFKVIRWMDSIWIYRQISLLVALWCLILDELATTYNNPWVIIESNDPLLYIYVQYILLPTNVRVTFLVFWFIVVILSVMVIPCEKFTHNLQAYFTATGAIAWWLPLCQ